MKINSAGIKYKINGKSICFIQRHHSFFYRKEKQDRQAMIENPIL